MRCHLTQEQVVPCDMCCGHSRNIAGMQRKGTIYETRYNHVSRQPVVVLQMHLYGLRMAQDGRNMQSQNNMIKGKMCVTKSDCFIYKIPLLWGNKI
jgi:hypothetical protein